MKKTKISLFTDTNSPIHEAYKILRSNIHFSSGDQRLHTIVVTSSIPGEGKSTTACNLAIAMSQVGKKTILLDCDLRKPTMHRIFNLSNECGLTNLIVGDAILADIINKTEGDNLCVITSGTRPPNPSELLATEKMGNLIKTLKEEYEYIIIDTPPAVMVTDAQVLAQFADGYLLVVGGGEVHRETAVAAKNLLEKVNAKILGVVLNKKAYSQKAYYGDYNSYFKKNQRQLKKEKKHLEKVSSK